MPSAFVTSAALGLESIDQPTARRENVSRTTAQYTLPSRVPVLTALVLVAVGDRDEGDGLGQLPEHLALLLPHKMLAKLILDGHEGRLEVEVNVEDWYFHALPTPFDVPVNLRELLPDLPLTKLVRSPAPPKSPSKATVAFRTLVYP